MLIAGTGHHAVHRMSHLMKQSSELTPRQRLIIVCATVAAIVGEVTNQAKYWLLIPTACNKKIGFTIGCAPGTTGEDSPDQTTSSKMHCLHDHGTFDTV